jgi:transcriptional regulator of acetoin/glycerol metabolism
MLADGGRLYLRPPVVDAECLESSYDLSLALDRTLREVTDEVTKAMCLEALKRSNGNKKEAASILDISRDSLYRYIKRFGIESESETRE